MAEFWSGSEGRFIQSYLLGACIGVTGNAAIYKTEYGDNSRPAIIKLVQADSADWEEQLATWGTLAQHSHPHLIRVLDAGQCKVTGVPLLFVVTERAEGNLADALLEGPLTTAEVREMMEAAASALTYLHENGFEYGGVKPSDIVAVREQVKLSIDPVVRTGSFRAGRANGPYDPPELKAGMSSAPADVWSLGITLVQALTQRLPDIDSFGNPVVPDNLPEPFLEIARHSLRVDPQSRWTALEIASQLKPHPEVLHLLPKSKSRRIPPRIYIGASIIAFLLAVLSLVFVRRETGPPSPPTAPAPAAPATSPAIQPQQAVSTPAGDWFVVAATYVQEADAAKRALAMNRKWPRFNAEVYSPPLKGQKPYYLVIIGSNLSQKEADQLRARARSAGVARDAYVTRFPAR